MVKARKYVLRSHFSGVPKREDLEIVEEELPPLKDGGQEGGDLLLGCSLKLSNVAFCHCRVSL